MSIRIPDLDLRLTQADEEAVKVGLLGEAPADLPDPAAEIEKLLQSRPLPERKPAFGRIVADSLGYLWVADSHWSRDDDAEWWRVFNPAGTWLGRVAMPKRFRVLEIGSDYVVGRHRDEYDVESVRLYRLTR
jgi:hypothetical protein